jgi:hypothetical protein
VNDLRGLRLVAADARYAITRQYVQADGLRRGRDPLLTARLSFEDAVRIGDREARVALRLEQVR